MSRHVCVALSSAFHSPENGEIECEFTCCRVLSAFIQMFAI